jgi:lantibiotic biosynthesis dehydratase-like protein
MRTTATVVGSLPPVDCPVTVAPFIAVRVAGLPSDALTPLDATRTLDHFATADTAAERARELAGPVADTLHAAVPTLPTALRRRALRLRREVHNGRCSEAAAAAAAELAELLPADAAALLAAWRVAVDAERAAERGAEDAFRMEVRRGAAHLMAVLTEAPVVDGLAYASPGFVDQLLSRGGARPVEPGGRTSRTAVSYLARATVKASPFSTLGTVAVGSLGGARTASADDLADDLDRGAAHREPVGPRSHAVTVLYALATSVTTADAVEVVGNRSLYAIDGRSYALLPQRHCRRGFYFREEELTDVGIYAPILPLLPSDPVPIGRWAARLTAGSGAVGHAMRLACRLVELGLLVPVPPWQDDRESFAALARLPIAPTVVRERLETLSKLEAEMAADPPARERVVVERRARAAVADTLAATGAVRPPWLADAAAFYENVAFTGGPPVALPAAVRDDLVDLGRHLAPGVLRSPLYTALVDHFVERYGAGGSCPNPLDLLYSFRTRPDFERVLRAVLAAIRVPQRPQPLVGHGTAGRPVQMAFFQVAARGWSDIERGDYALVVNSINAGPGGLVSRWGSIPALNRAVGEPMRRWLADLYPGCRVYQFSAGADWAAVQRLPLDLATLGWPGDIPEKASTAAPLADFTFTHHRSSGTLQAFDRDGTRSAFAYLGVLPQHLLTGTLQLFSHLADPWLTLVRAGSAEGYGHQPTPPEDLDHHARRVSGRLVLERARWTVPVDLFPTPAASEPADRFLRRFVRWRRDAGVPDELFCRFIPRTAPLAGASRQKPMWVGAANPHAVFALCRGIPAGTGWVELTEALPSRRDLWYRDDDGRRRAVEFTAVLRLG